MAMSEAPNVNNAYLSVACPRLIFILLDDRSAFDQIEADICDGGDKGELGHVIVKSVGGTGETTVVFQHWVKKPLLSPLIERRLAAQRGPSREYRNMLDAGDRSHA
jgi:hypothetical protein